MKGGAILWESFSGVLVMTSLFVYVRLMREDGGQGQCGAVWSFARSGATLGGSGGGEKPRCRRNGSGVFGSAAVLLPQ